MSELEPGSHAPKWWWGMALLTTGLIIVFLLPWFTEDAGYFWVILLAVIAVFLYVQAIRSTIRSRRR
ncbi:hypothetical protein [Agromyces sp. NPDC058110]|uniref:hypothetical protein n=1 Tax=Agromyces sp. NPDC058110 TaxID=3346345 RepID=UPI0036DD6371